MAKILFIGKFQYFENLTVMFLGGFLKKQGHKCHYIDLKFTRNYIREIKIIQPSIIAYSVLTANYKMFLKVNQKIKKEYNFFSVFGGLHCTVYPEMIFEEGVDAICRGEGEYPLLELADLLEKGQDISSIKNLWVKTNNQVFKNELRELYQNIDEICFPDRSIFDKYNHYRNILSRVTIAGRGCPHSCTYCYNNQIKEIYYGKGKYTRLRSVQNVIAELKLVKEKYKPKRIKLFDDTFILGKKWGLEFCDSYQKEISIPFIAVIRLNYFDEELIIAMKNAGCISVVFGIECGDEDYRYKILNRQMSNDQIITTSHLFLKHGIKTDGLNMVGLPGETIESCIETLKLNILCKVSFAHTVMYLPLPNTDLCNYAISHVFFDGDTKNTRQNYMFNKGVLKMKDIRKIKRLQYLFSIMVAFPFLLPFLRFLIWLPITKLYQPIFYLHRVYNHLYITQQIDWQDIFRMEPPFKKKFSNQ